MLTMTIHGVKELAKGLDMAEKRVRQAIEATVYAQTIALVQLINRNNMVPVNTGRLRSSTFVTMPRVVAGRFQCVLGYAAPYAGDIHERGSGKYRVGWSASNRGGKISINKHAGGKPQWLKRAKELWSRSYSDRAKKSFVMYLQNGVKASDLRGVIPESAAAADALSHVGIATHQKKHGFTWAQKSKLKQLKKAGLIRLVGRRKGKTRKHPSNMKAAYDSVGHNMGFTYGPQLPKLKRSRKRKKR